ncbi:hypothetical protein AN958_03468 [Leucoagaricus sp. SymC.cos]|nr:hypothetical protein AN958_03468 [Leucoagaricus sp. SymC.cos]
MKMARKRKKRERTEDSSRPRVREILQASLGCSWDHQNELLGYAYARADQKEWRLSSTVEGRGGWSKERELDCNPELVALCVDWENHNLKGYQPKD